MGLTNVKVFIAYSAEVKEEKEKCILTLKQVNQRHKHLNLDPVEWEYDLIHGKQRDFAGVKKIITPMLNECTICIFIFHSKIGKYTKEEFKLAFSMSKKLLVFFKYEFAPKNKAENTKYRELLEFKESMNETTLCRSYISLTNFELSLEDNLHLYLNYEFPVPVLRVFENNYFPPEVITLIRI